MKQNQKRYWVNVVSHEHVKTGLELGIVQSCHGKATPLRRMKQGDWIAHYSPKEMFMGKEPCQKFTSIGQIADEEIYQFDMGGGFIPWRRRVRYVDSEPLAIAGLLEELSFTQGRGPRWGAMFRYGFFEMQENDFKLIYSAMTGIPIREVQ